MRPVILPIYILPLRRLRRFLSRVFRLPKLSGSSSQRGSLITLVSLAIEVRKCKIYDLSTPGDGFEVHRNYYAVNARFSLRNDVAGCSSGDATSSHTMASLHHSHLLTHSELTKLNFA